MNKLGHVVLGFVTGIAFLLVMDNFLGWFSIYDFKSWIIYSIIIFIYSLLPDIDHKNSAIVWLFLGLGVLGMLVGFYVDNDNLFKFSALLIGITFVAAQYFPHRGPTHTIWFALLTSVPIYIMFGIQESLLSLLVYYSHLAGDREFFKVRF